MKKNVFIESVLLKINGGQLNDSASVDRRDIAAYLGAAINYAMMAGYNQSIQQDGIRDFPGAFYGYFQALTVSVDATRHNWKYITLPKGTIPLPKNQGIRSVEDGCGNTFKILSDNSFRTIMHYKSILNGASYFRLEGNKIYLFSSNPLIEKINLSMIVNVDDLSPDDELPIPAGFEAKALDLAYQYITGERTNPADRKSDERDIN